jgi:hypothetical protein
MGQRHSSGTRKRELRRREPKDKSPNWSMLGVNTASCLGRFCGSKRPPASGKTLGENEGRVPQLCRRDPKDKSTNWAILGSKRPRASGKPIRKGGGLRPPPFLGLPEAAGRFDPQNQPI